MRTFFLTFAASSACYEETCSNCSLNIHSIDIADDIADAAEAMVDTVRNDFKRKSKLGNDEEDEQSKYIPRFGSWLADTHLYSNEGSVQQSPHRML